MQKEIIHLTFEEVLPIWANDLWPNRQSKIESNSAMCFKGGYDMQNMFTTPTFFAAVIGGKIVGVNSGHMCTNSSYRSRGLFVYPEFRGYGIGVDLLKATINQGILEDAKMIWSYPKKSSWSTYSKAGFTLASDWEQSELDINAYCQLDVQGLPYLMH